MATILCKCRGVGRKPVSCKLPLEEPCASGESGRGRAQKSGKIIAKISDISPLPSCWRIAQLMPQSRDLVWSALPGNRYELWQSTNLQSGGTTASRFPAKANGPANAFLDRWEGPFPPGAMSSPPSLADQSCQGGDVILRLADQLAQPRKEL